MPTTIETYFPTGIVVGKNFCNREKERDLLAKRLRQNAHIVLMSPRRYGKSSLIAQFTHDMKIPFAAVDLLPASSGKYVKNAIVDGVSHLLNSSMPTLQKAKEKILSLFVSMNPVIELSALGQKIKINERIKLQPDESTEEETIMKVLMLLDKAAGELNKQFIFVMDEFQQVANLDESHPLEACIRHAVERSKNVFYIFSGSNRTLLEAMFKKKERPLYHLCDEIKLNRIDHTEYKKFITKAAKQRWGVLAPEASIDEILALTECHPYYVNRLCRALWDLDSPPSKEVVATAWKEYVDSQITDWVSDIIGKLSPNQKTVLAALAKSPESELSGKKFTLKLAMPASSIQRTINTLKKQDLIFKDHTGHYRVLNPVMKTYLVRVEYYDF